MYDFKDLSLPALGKGLASMKDSDASQHEKYLATALAVVIQQIENCQSEMKQCRTQMQDCQSKMQQCESQVGRLTRSAGQC